MCLQRSPMGHAHVPTSQRMALSANGSISTTVSRRMSHAHVPVRSAHCRVASARLDLGSSSNQASQVRARARHGLHAAVRVPGLGQTPRASHTRKLLCTSGSIGMCARCAADCMSQPCCCMYPMRAMQDVPGVQCAPRAAEKDTSCMQRRVLSAGSAARLVEYPRTPPIANRMDI